MSHATLLDVLDTARVWSIARASSAMSYKSHLAACDLKRATISTGEDT
jgi:hypothetical protein